MLTLLGLATIGILLVCVLFRLTSVVVALVLVPLVVGTVGGFGGAVGAYALSGIQSVAGTAAMFGFAVLYFGVMRDAGLFAPLIRAILRVCGRDPQRLVVGTALVAMLTHLDGAGASTFLITVPALLPVYQRMGLEPGVLACTVALAAGTMNVVPWGGPTLRAATALQVDVAVLFAPLLLPLLAGLVGVLLVAAWLGHGERVRLASTTAAPLEETSGSGPGPEGADTESWSLRFLVNGALTLVTIVALVLEWLPLPVVFMVAFVLALLVNHPDPRAQRDVFDRHGSPAIMVGLVLAAGVLAGVMRESGMLAAMGQSLVSILPATLVTHLPVAMATTAMPLSLAFDPDSFYFGVLPVIAAASDATGIPGIEVARAALMGQMTTGFPVSPLTPATFILIGLSGVDLGRHQRRTIPWALAISWLMTATAVVTGAFRF